MVARDAQEAAHWDDPVRLVARRGLALHYVDLYDFDRFGFVDYEYFQVLIAECEEFPHIVGRLALVRVDEATIVLDRTKLPSEE
jgi:hypothetical protein